MKLGLENLGYFKNKLNYIYSFNILTYSSTTSINISLTS